MVIEQKNIVPCKICGALPVNKTIKSKNRDITVKIMAYPCNCLDREEEANKKQKIWNDLLRRSKIPPRYRAASLDYTGRSPYENLVIPLCCNYISRLTDTLRHTKETIFTPLEGFGLIGDVGTGKTHYICAIALALLRAGHTCLFLNVPDFYDALKRCFSNNDDNNTEKYANLLDSARETEIVAFDDIGAEYNTQWTVDELCKIINYRYNYNLITLFTSNLRAKITKEVLPSELENKIGKRATDRLREMCRVHLITGDSLRGKKKHPQIL